MPTLVTQQGIVHYEVYGRGSPVILLHGWLGSWALWRDTFEELGKEFRTYALDFFGFGDSQVRTQDFSVNNFVELVSQFIDRLGIVRPQIVGHSMGGTVALALAARYPHKVSKVTVIGSPIVGSSLNVFLKLSGYQSIARLIFTAPFILNTFIYGITHLAAKDGPTLHKMVKADVSKVTADSFFQSIGTLHKTDLRPQLPGLQMPILGIYGRKDIIVRPNQGKVLLQHSKVAREAFFEGSGHFPMMDEPDRFFQTVRNFLRER